jgi:hypothetical protein
LAREFVALPTLEAAVVVAHPSLIGLLERFTAPSELPYIDNLAIDALAACEKGVALEDR